MSYTNETTHYAIPLPLGSDKTTPMDYNQSAQEVDTVLFEAKTDSASALQKANQLQQDLSTTNDNVTGVTGRVTTLEGTVTTQGQAILQNTQDISDVRADALDMIVAKDEGTAQVASVAVAEGEYFRYNDVLYIATQAIAVGDTIVPNTNCKATNVGTELNQLNNDLNIKGAITRDTNWDNITQGRYNVNTWSGTDTPSNNYPSHRGIGLLEVIGNEPNNITQKVMFTNGYFYYRIKNSGTWADWVLVDTNSPLETLSPTIGDKVTNHITFTRVGHKLILAGYFQVTSNMVEGDIVANFGDTIAPIVNQGVTIFGTSGTSGSHPLSFRKTSGRTILTVGENVSTGYYNVSALFIIS